ncbi:cell division protein FtsW [Propionibacterium cyclohexanicum]|uniref:Probable peptidoglycan glycosyltransferase FtsW n=1 Tax=Propionibacterium cyclohexanicum TaxID=64702 RepID=A0A1H9PL73_9ACTN|nr:putative peptidoglycan glycosyltransferase FtsW [Propionibacterium cyclohexanicum]SER48323.1 cell division protein FtsW [Propionibacterium cyclohexanicum]
MSTRDDLDGPDAAGVAPGPEGALGDGSLKRALSLPLTNYYLVIASAGLLVALGALMVLSSSSVYAAVNQGDPYYFFVRQIVWLGVGIPVTIWISRRGEEFLKLAGWLLLGGVVVAEALVLFTPLGTPRAGISNKGNRNWLYIGGQSIQPSEFAKLALILWAAGVLANRTRTLNEPKRLFMPFLLGFGLVLALVLLGGDLGTSIIIAIIMLSLLWFAGAPVWTLLGMVAVGAAGVAAMIVSRPTRLQRVEAYLSGSATVGSSEQPLNAIYALATGGWWGVGLGASRAKWGGLYDGALNDYVFAVLGEELGLLGTLTVIGLFLVLGVAGLRIALNSDRPFWRLASAATTAWLMAQACMNIAMAMKLLPVVGVPLPFISYGGSALLADLVAVGVLLAAARHEPAARQALKSSGRTAAPVRISTVIDRKG